MGAELVPLAPLFPGSSASCHVVSAISGREPRLTAMFTMFTRLNTNEVYGFRGFGHGP